MCQGIINTTNKWWIDGERHWIPQMERVFLSAPEFKIAPPSVGYGCLCDVFPVV